MLNFYFFFHLFSHFPSSFTFSLCLWFSWPGKWSLRLHFGVWFLLVQLQRMHSKDCLQSVQGNPARKQRTNTQNDPIFLFSQHQDLCIFWIYRCNIYLIKKEIISPVHPSWCRQFLSSDNHGDNNRRNYGKKWCVLSTIRQELRVMRYFVFLLIHKLMRTANLLAK